MPVSPNRPKGPPLNALRAFEAAARLGGFLAAAEELGVTPGAVSQHIKSLESWVGAPLFERRAQGVGLTALGLGVSGDFGVAFDALGAAVRQLKAGSVQQSIAIAALPSVAQLWLAPRMPALRAALPGIEFSITALETRPNLAREMFDLCLFIDVANGGAQETVLMQDLLTPVCAPELAVRLATPADLAHETWIFDGTWGGDWAVWARQILPDMTVKSGPAHSLYSVAMADAESGGGVLIGHSCLVEHAIVRGSLVVPFEAKVPSGLSLNLETAPDIAPAVLQVLQAILAD